MAVDLTDLATDDVFLRRLAADDPPREPDVMAVRRLAIALERDASRWELSDVR